MAGDKDTLLSMGFDPARVECSLSNILPLNNVMLTNCFHIFTLNLFAYSGALKATANRGLQPAMDHILEHEGEDVPDLAGVNEQPAGRGPMDVDEDDEDAEALKSLGALQGNAVEAKVCIRSRVNDMKHPLTTVITPRSSRRVSNVRCAVKSSRTLPWQISTLRRVDMINSRNLRRRCVRADRCITIFIVTPSYDGVD